MKRPVSNPPNPWAGPHVEYLGEAPQATLQVYEEQAKSIVTQNDSPDVPFRYSVNPYRGCQHACAYCYARSGHRFLDFGAGTDFDTRIVVKRNAPELLQRHLRRRSWQGDWIAFSGVTDCYQPLEASFGLTRACLEVCLAARNPVGIITKGALIRRDLDLLVRLHERASLSVHISIPFSEEDACRRIEPLAPSPALRFETLRVLADAGLPVGVALAPLIPGLNDSQVPRILEQAAAAGARSAFMLLLRLSTEVRPVFEERLKEAFPLRSSKVMAALDDMRSAQSARQRSQFGARMTGTGPRWESVRGLFELHCRRLGLRAVREEQLVVVRPAGRERQRDLFAP